MTDLTLEERLRDCADALDEFTVTFDGKSSKLSGPEIMREAADAIDAHMKAKGEVGELVERLRDDADLIAVDNPKDLGVATLREAADTITAQAGEIERLREALKPFAFYLDTMSADLDSKGRPLPANQGMGWVYLKISDFRRARTALKQKGAAND